jgi:hypothetical protein
MDITNNETHLEWMLPAVDRDGTPVVLRTIGNAATFLQAAFDVPQRFVSWQHAYKALETAARDGSQVKHATEAVQAVLEADRLLAA